MMKRILIGSMSLVSVLPVLCGEPLVVAFDRFHAKQPTAEGGRLLFNELGCANCHGGDTGLPARRGPNLMDVTQRVQAGWLRAFLTDPAADPHELKNLVADPRHAAVVAKLSALARAHVAGKTEPTPVQ